MDSDSSHWIAALRRSHEHLRALVEPLDAARLGGPSYASEWSVAQVLSHLGSGAEIFSLFLDAALTGTEPPGREQFEPIWASWNAKPVEEKAADSLSIDARFVDRISALEPERRDALRLALFGMDLDLVGLLRMRLGEHAMHTWDIAVAQDATATVIPDAVVLLVDTLDQLVARTGKPSGEPGRVAVHTTAPERDFVLDIGDSVTLAADDGGAPGSAHELRIPAEALLRLVYGRLDPAHTPPLEAKGVDLDVLRGVFPGF
jgi:uncharacterized protein (TIGR03083 family)